MTLVFATFPVNWNGCDREKRLKENWLVFTAARAPELSSIAAFQRRTSLKKSLVLGTK